MNMFEAFVLALIQGLTEFLPVSSSAHLILPSVFLGWHDQGLAFDVAVHVGTLLAVVGYFRHEVCRLLAALFRSIFKQERSADASLAWMIALSTIPACIFGITMKGVIEQYLRSGWVIAVTCIVFGLVLGWADATAKQKSNEYRLTPKHALAIGVAQALAMIPGTSRSGMTMTIALSLGYTREAAARISFLMSIPIIVLAGSYLSYEMVERQLTFSWQPMLVGVGVSFISAYACIHWFLKWVTRVGMKPFVYYRIALGVVLIGYLVSQS